MPVRCTAPHREGGDVAVQSLSGGACRECPIERGMAGRASGVLHSRHGAAAMLGVAGRAAWREALALLVDRTVVTGRAGIIGDLREEPARSGRSVATGAFALELRVAHGYLARGDEGFRQRRRAPHSA